MFIPIRLYTSLRDLYRLRTKWGRIFCQFVLYFIYIKKTEKPQPSKEAAARHREVQGLQNGEVCRGLVLAGGGARGSYQVGVWRALDELGWRPEVIAGTSVGSLNGAMFALDLYETARSMWLTLRSEDVMELPARGAELSELRAFVQDLVQSGGLDVTPLEEIVDRVLDEQALRAAPVRFGLVTVEKRGLRPRELALEEIPEGKLADYLLASAACWPAFRPRKIDGVEYLDGGYTDNMPTGLAKRLGAEELVCVDLEGVGITRPNRTGLPTILVRSYWDLGDILKFSPETARRNMELGYFDTMRAFGRLRGCAYAVTREGNGQAEWFRARFDALRRQVAEKWPAAHISGSLALALANLQDESLAPLEAAAEEAGVDPTALYSVESLGQAFLEKCDRSKLAAFDPMFEGEAPAALIARAALMPSQFLQALVCRVLAGPSQEVMRL